MRALIIILNSVYIKRLYILCVSLFFITCTTTNDKESTSPIIDISKSAFKETVEQNLSTIATKIEYIPLETRENALLGRMFNSDLRFCKDKIILKDNGVVYMFNQKGKFLNTIGNKGNGPGEHSDNFLFSVLEEDELVAVYDRRKQKVFFYKFDGSFNSEFEIEFRPDAFITFNDHLIFMNSEFNRKDTDYHIVTIMTKGGEVVKRLLQRPNEKKEDSKFRPFISSEPLSQNILNDHFYFIEGSITENKTIWELSKNFELKMINTINIGGNRRPLKEYTAKLVNETFFKYDAIHSYMETTRYKFFKSLRGGEDPPHAYVYYDKEKKEKYTIRTIEEGEIRHRFVNDIDGGMPFYPFFRISKNRVVVPLDVLRLKKWLEKHKAADQQAIDIEGGKHLETLVSNAKDDDNPILMVVTLKE